MPTKLVAQVLLVTLAAGLSGCADPESNPPPVITVAALPSTTDQSALVGTTLAQPLTVQVAADGAPLAGVTVAWEASAGSVGRTTSVTDAEGLTTSAWTLGVEPGVQTATATVAEAHGSPVTFSARALAPPSEPPPVEPPAPPPIEPPAPPPPHTPVGVGRVIVFPSEWQVRPGESYQLRATPWDLYSFPIPGATVKWASRPPGIATISASGLLTGVVPGSTTIIAAFGLIRGTAAITVLGPIVSVKLAPTPATLAVGEEAFWGIEARDARGTLMARVDPAWRSDNPGIAFAEPHGRIIGVHPGTAEIAATVEGVTGKARLTVIAPLDLSGDWSMQESFSDGYATFCAASGTVALGQGQWSALVHGTYHRAGICLQRGTDSLDLTGAVPLHGTIAGSSISLESSAPYHCQYQGLVAGGSPNRVDGRVACTGLPGTPEEGSEYGGRFTMTK